mgnify:CR=1 FL=1
MDIFNELNAEQIEAVKTIKGPVLILAGAGSGKTKTLTHRIAHLISQNIKPENILAVTFTNKAAEEMKIRVKKLIDASYQQDTKYKILNTNLFIGTFHSLGVKILRSDIEKLDYKNNFVIYDEDDTLSLAKNIRNEMKILRAVFSKNIKMTKELNFLFMELKKASIKGWKIEDVKRDCERKKDFG